MTNLLEPMGKVELAYNAYHELVETIRIENMSYLNQGRLLKKIRDEKLYLSMGEGGYDTFLNFLNNAEIGMKQAKAYSLISIYEYFVLKLKIDESKIIEHKYSRLFEILPKLKTIPDEEAVAKFENSSFLTNYDFNEFKKEHNLPPKPSVYFYKETNKWRIKTKAENIDLIEIDNEKIQF